MRRAALLLIVVLVGCGDDDDGPPNVSVDEDNVCAEVAEVLCFNMYRCCSEGEIENVLGVDEPRTEAECRDDLEVLCERGAAQVFWSVDEGRVTVDVETINGCLEAIIAPDGTCAVVATEAPWEVACEPEQYVGTVGVGGECFFQFDCAGEAYCAADRKCADLPGDGENCSAFGCATGLFCNGGTCEALLDLNDPCFSFGSCREGLYCDFTATPQAVCAQVRAVGESCTSPSACETQVCVPGVCESNGTQCYVEDDCSGSCEGTGQFCFNDFDCDGQCRDSGFFCFDDFDCDTTVAEPCVRPACQRECIGDPFCGESYVVFDYCQDTPNFIP